MVIWKKEKKEEQKVLTERDIQERLYGSFHRFGEPKVKKESASSGASVDVAPPQEKELFQTENKEETTQVDFDTSVATETEAEEKDRKPEVQDKPKEAASVLDAPPQDDDLSRRARELELRFDEETKTIEEKPLDEYFPFSKRREGFKIKHLSHVWMKLDQIKEKLAGLPHKQLLMIVGGIIVFLIIFNVVSNLAVKKGVEVAVPLVQSDERDVSGDQSQEKQVKPKPRQASSAATVTRQSSAPKAQREPKVITPVTAGGRRYTVQICVYQNENDAKQLVKKLNSEKHVSFYDSFVTRRGQKFYRVFVGQFATFQQAKKATQNYSNSPEMKNFKDSFIRSIESLS